MWNIKTKTKTKLIEKVIKSVTRGGGGDGGERILERVVKRYKLPVTRYIRTRDVMHNMMTTANTAV